MIIRFVLWVFLLNNFIISLKGQNTSPYTFRNSTEITLPVVGLGTAGLSYYFHRNKPILTDEQIASLTISDINAFDQKAVYQWRPKSARLSDALMFTAIASPLLLMTSQKIRNDWEKPTVLGLEVFFLNLGLTGLTKELVRRPRPYVYNPDVPISMKTSRDATTSMYSGHTSTAASMTMFSAITLQHYHKGAKWMPLVWTSAAILPLGTGILRYRAGKHFWSDIITGYVAGCLTGLLVPVLHRR